MHDQVDPLTEAQWHAMSREQRAAYLREHQRTPSADDLAWAEAQVPAIEAVRADAASFRTVGDWLREHAKSP